MAIGLKQITKETPRWAKWMFRITFIITTSTVGYLAATDLFDKSTKYEITLFLKLFVDPIVFGVSKLFGVDIKQEENV